MDSDLQVMSREQLMDETQKLRDAIRTHRDSASHELCWHHPALWGLLPETTDPVPVVPDWPQFMQGCVRYRQSLDQQAPRAPRSGAPYQARTQRTGAIAIGAMALGALAVGALAVGALAIGRLAVGNARFGRVQIGDLDVRRLRYALPGLLHDKDSA
jgi:hypothetical protein